MATLSLTPAFAHDCTRCRLIAHVKPVSGQAFDAYVCEGGSIVARTGSDGPDYVSVDSAMRSTLAAFRGTKDALGRAIWLAENEVTIRGLMAL